MTRKWQLVAALMYTVTAAAVSGDRTICSLRDMSSTELKYMGIELPHRTTVHIKSLGGGGDYGWIYKSNRMFAYGWIINADTRSLVWRMTNDNTSRSGDDRSFDGDITLEPGSYEVYFTAYAFSYHTAFTHVLVNIDHRQKPLFEPGGEKPHGFFSIFKHFWSDDIGKEWEKRSKTWGMDLSVDEAASSGITTFTPPRIWAGTVLRSAPLGDNELVKKAFSLSSTTTLHVYALGEGYRERDLSDFGWIVDAQTRKRCWEMSWKNVSPAGGAEKNIGFSGDITLPRGEYVLYYVTDDSHSFADWNDAPPDDPLFYGVTVAIWDESARRNFKAIPYNEDRNLIVAITRVGDNQYRSEGFNLKSDCAVRIYAFGERSNSRAQMADYGTILDAKTRQKVWTMDLDRTYPGGGAPKNRFVDEVIPLSRGSYIVTYQTDDSHAYGEWNAGPPFDPEHYGISVMGVCSGFSGAMVSKYEEQRDKNIVAQIIRVGDNADKSERFSLSRPTRVRIYSIGEGQNREMYDYGWIENAQTGNVVWEMTYGMTTYAGGGRKNRMVNTTVILDRGDYLLRFRSDDSHSFNNWNVDPPEDPQHWGITLYRDETPDRDVPPPPPGPAPRVPPPPGNVPHPDRPAPPED